MEKLKVALPKNQRKFHTKQTYDHMPGGKGGVMRGIMVGPGSSGKTVTLQWLLLGPWRGLADKIAIWSPTIFFAARLGTDHQIHERGAGSRRREILVL